MPHTIRIFLGVQINLSALRWADPQRRVLWCNRSGQMKTDLHRNGVEWRQICASWKNARSFSGHCETRFLCNSTLPPYTNLKALSRFPRYLRTVRGFRPFALSVGQSLQDSKRRSRPKRTWYQQHSSGTPFALKPMVPGEIGDGSKNSTEDEWSHASSTPLQRVKKIIEIVLERHRGTFDKDKIIIARAR